MRRRASLALIAVSLLLGAPRARADLASARDKLSHGDYAGAAKELEQITGKQADAARLVRGQLLLRTGAYADAEAMALKVTKAKDAAVAADGHVLHAEVLRTTGRLAEARTELEAQAQKLPDHLRTRYTLGLVYRDLGEKQLAEQTFTAFSNDYNANKVNLNDPEQLFFVAEAWRYLGDFEDASGTYGNVIDLDPSFHDANIAWGYLFLDKFAPGDAEQSFDAVLKIDPHHPDALAGMAAVKIQASYDLAEATTRLNAAFAINPHHVPSLLLRAGLEIDRNEWDKAKATLAEVFAINPNNLEAHAQLATIDWLRDDDKGYQAEKAKVFALNPAYAEFFHTVAASAVREHRYKEAIDLETEAVGVDPDYYDAMEAIGSGYLRLGDEKDGLDWLRKAWKGDQFNVRTKNTLDLFEDIIPKDYSFASSKNFKIRYHNDEKAVLRRYLEPLLEKAFADMVQRYGFTPVTPVIVELYDNSDNYSVRTVGLPNLGALGVCFGQVITAMSPSVGDINWQMVVWHELGHIFAIQLSHSRVPRWFTEGLSEYETVRARPEWRRENDADVWAAMADGTLPSVAELNYDFMKPDIQDVVVAYHLSSVTIEYIAQTYGFPKIVEALKLYGKGKETPEVIETITGKKVAAFDQEFRAYLAVRLAPYKGTFHVPTAGFDDLKKLEIAAAAKPDDPKTLSNLALGYFYDGNAPESEKAANQVLALAPKNPIALYILAELAVRGGQLDVAKQHYEALIKVGGDGFDVRSRLAMIAAKQGDNPTAIKHLCAAKKLDPERSYPYQALSELYQQMGKRTESLRELETYVMIEQMQYAPAKQLVDAYSSDKAWEKVRVYGELALAINPDDPDLLLKLGQAYVETGSAAEGLFAYDSALLVKPELRRPAVAQLGRTRAYLALGQKKEAQQALAAALKLEPENAEGLALKAQVK